jgi:hypothetical protein
MAGQSATGGKDLIGSGLSLFPVLLQSKDEFKELIHQQPWS